MKRQWIVWGIAMMLCGVVLTGDSVQAQLQRVEPMRVLLRSWGASGERALYIYDVTTATLDPITPLYEDRIVCVSVSPDNTRVVYKTAGRASSDRLFLLNLIDGDVREIEVRDYVSCAEWSPDSERLLYAGQQGGTFNIFSIRVNAGIADLDSVQRLTNFMEGSMSPAIAPDGDHIAFVSWDSLSSMVSRMSSFNTVNYAQIFVMTADNNAIRQLTDAPINHSNPVWRP